MDEKDYPSSSDESDADFVPEGEESNSGSGSEVTDDETPSGDEKTGTGRKRKKAGKKKSKKLKTGNETDGKDKEKEDNVEEEEDTEKRVDIDALWADFKKDVNSKEVKKTAPSTEAKAEETKTSSVPNAKVRGVPSFSNRPKVGGLSSVLNKIGKKEKISTLQKSQLDWNNFKKSEGIEEEIKLHNRGKDGYLEKQDFLQRTDLRQFEIEKGLRSSRRKF